VATIQIEESAHAELVEKSSRATALEAEKTAAEGRATVAEAAVAEANDTAALAIVTAALEAAGISAPKTAARLAEGYKVKENGVLDQEALQLSVAESVAELQVAGGAGSVRGVGESAAEPAKAEVSYEDASKQILAFSGYTPKGA
jgi:aminoglycoside/choline kinase family phosphotransferase